MSNPNMKVLADNTVFNDIKNIFGGSSANITIQPIDHEKILKFDCSSSVRMVTVNNGRQPPSTYVVFDGPSVSHISSSQIEEQQTLRNVGDSCAPRRMCGKPERVPSKKSHTSTPKPIKSEPEPLDESSEIFDSQQSSYIEVDKSRSTTRTMSFSTIYFIPNAVQSEQNQSKITSSTSNTTLSQTITQPAGNAYDLPTVQCVYCPDTHLCPKYSLGVKGIKKSENETADENTLTESWGGKRKADDLGGMQPKILAGETSGSAEMHTKSEIPVAPVKGESSYLFSLYEEHSEHNGSSTIDKTTFNPSQRNVPNKCGHVINKTLPSENGKPNVCDCGYPTFFTSKSCCRRYTESVQSNETLVQTTPRRSARSIAD